MKTIFLAIYSFFTNRLFILSIAVLALFYILVATLFDLQIVDGNEHAEAFDLKVVREVDSKGQRGNIYDRYGVPLAENIMAYDVQLNDSYEVQDKNSMIHELVSIIRGHGDEVLNEFPLVYKDMSLQFEGSELDIKRFKKGVFNHLYVSRLSEEELLMEPKDVFFYMCEDLFEISLYEYTTFEALDILNIRYSQYISRYSKYNPDTIAVNISEETLAELEEKRDYFPGVIIIESPFRVYNDAPYFAHIIGYTRDISADKLTTMETLGYDSEDQVGFTGIEKELESYLRGFDGNQKVEVNNLGKTMLVLEEISPLMGNDVFLTIDHDLQIETYHILEQQMANIIVDKLYMNYPKPDDTRYVLLKDVFDSIFRYELIDIDALGKGFSSSGLTIYNEMNEIKTKLVTSASEEIESDGLPKDFRNNQAIYYYILNQFKAKEYLDTYFYRSEYYELFVAKKITFNQLMQALYEEGHLIIPLSEGEIIYAKLPVREEDDKSPYATDFEVDEVLKVHLHNHIFDDFLKRHYLDKYMYLYALDEEEFDYFDLTKLIIDVNLVSATESQIAMINKRRLKPIDFMKEKILTIELTPQELALDPSSGSVVITDVDTGEVLALVSYPTYDNNRLVNQFDGAYYVEQLNDPTSPLLPRGTMSRTVPGSTFKMLSGIAALEEGVVGLNEYVHTTGYFTKIWPPASCWIYASRKGTHGNLTLEGAIEQSCNYYFYEMGYRLGITETGKYNAKQGITIFQDYIARFGLDATTGLEIGEQSSTMPEHDPVRASIGQEKLGFTPVQLARYMNVLVNDGVVSELNLVDKVMTKDGMIVEDFTPKLLKENNFEQVNLDAVKEGMLKVTSGSRGTARSYFSDIDLDIAGKTGTAEIRSLDSKSIDPVRAVIKRPNHAVFTGFAPFDDPEISVVSMIQYAYSSKYAALNSKEVFRNYFDLEREVETLYTDNHLE